MDLLFHLLNCYFIYLKEVKSMKLKDNCEAVMQLLNSDYVGQALEKENGGVIPKNKIEHFVIIHASAPYQWAGSEDNKASKPTTRRKKKDLEELPFTGETEADRMASLSTMEEAEEDTELGRDEQKISLNQGAEIQVIRNLRKINCGSTSMLLDNGWFICPVYMGMTELSPVYVRKLPNKKGYRLIISDTPLTKIPEGYFNIVNLKSWELNSTALLNDAFYKEHIMHLSVKSIFIHKRNSFEQTQMRYAVNRFETTQRTRIKLGNILVDEVLAYVGQEAYVNSKEAIAMSRKSSSLSSTDEVTEYDMKDVKIIEYILDAYKRINKAAEDLGIKTIPIRLEKSYDKAIAEAVRREPIEHEERIQETLASWEEKPHEWSKAFKMYAKTHPDEELDMDDQELKKKIAALVTSKFSAKELICSFVTYLEVQNYMGAVKNEQDAVLVVNKLVHKHFIWDYLQGIKGCGEISAAYIIADIDFRATVHPSSVIRYMGMDNVIDTPKRAEDDMMDDDDASRIIRFLFHTYKNTSNRAKAENTQIYADNFYKYSSDMINTWDEFQAIRKVYQNPMLQELSPGKIINSDAGFKKLVNKLWDNCNIIEYKNEEGKYIPTIKKRARSKVDTVITTYIDKNGKIQTKRSLGYNAKLKSRIIMLLFDSLVKAKNDYYYKEIYLGTKNRLEMRYRVQGKNPEDFKMIIHLQARRHTMQIFMEELWMWVRNYLGYPTNGGTYYEAKLKATHHHGYSSI